MSTMEQQPARVQRRFTDEFKRDAVAMVLDERGERGVGAVAFRKVGEPQVPAGAVEQRHDGGTVERSGDQVAFEVTDLAALVGDRRPVGDEVELAQRNGLGGLAGPGVTGLAAPTPPVQPGVQTARSVRIGGLVDAFVARRCRHAVRTRRRLTRDRHPAVLGLQACLDVRRQRNSGLELRPLRSGTLTVRPLLRGGSTSTSQCSRHPVNSPGVPSGHFTPNARMV